MKETNIEWCDSTINGSSGCDGCELWTPGEDGDKARRSCYAGQVHETRWANSLAITHPQFYSPSFLDVKMIPGRFAKAAAWSDLRGRDRAGTNNSPYKPWLNGLPRMIFVGDMGDFMSRDVTDEFLINELFGAITSENGRRHFWLLLTKKPRRLAELSKRMSGGLPDNCMAMTTVTDQFTVNARIPALLDVHCKWRGLSCEPLLGEIDIRKFFWKQDDLEPTGLFRTTGGKRQMQMKVSKGAEPQIHWVIAGGESGNYHKPIDAPRPTDPGALRWLRDQTIAAGVPFFFKQWGAWFPADKWHEDLISKSSGEHTYCGPQYMLRIGKKSAGSNLDGREWKEMPDVGVSTSAVARSEKAAAV